MRTAYSIVTTVILSVLVYMWNILQARFHCQQSFVSTLMNVENVLIKSRESIATAFMHTQGGYSGEELTFVTNGGRKIHTQNTLL